MLADHGAGNRLCPVWKLIQLASLQGNLENDCMKEEAAERYDRSGVMRLNGERRVSALAIDPWTFHYVSSLNISVTYKYLPF